MPDLLAPPTSAAILRRLADAARVGRPTQGIARVEVPVPPVDALDWLAAQPTARRFYWEGRGEAAAHAASGEALAVEADSLHALAERLAPHLDGLPEEARFYGYVRFAPDEAPDRAWAPFGRIRFALPRVELRTDAAGASLALHLTPYDDEATVEDALDSLRLDPRPLDRRIPRPHSRADVPDVRGWRSAIEDALRRFERGPLEKAVLARRARLTFDAPLDPVALLAHLRAATPGSYHALAAVDGAAFLSATPERLLRVDGRRVETEAVAGTRPRASERPSDRQLQADLLASEKDRREHAYVADAIAATLTPLTDRLDRDGALSTLAGAGVRHLYTRLEGTLRDGVTALDVLRALHPTPAVGGTPTDEALAFLRLREPFDRGLYAGPIGWIGRDAAEVAVGIRSGLVRGATLDLFSGAGIVAGSDPAAEWAEIEDKLDAFLCILRLGDGD